MEIYKLLHSMLKLQNINDPTEIKNFYENLTSTTRNIPKYNVASIADDFNAQLDIQDGFNFALHEESNINGISLTDYILESVLCLNTIYQKKKMKYGHKSHQTEIKFSLIT